MTFLAALRQSIETKASDRHYATGHFMGYGTCRRLWCRLTWRAR